MLTLTIMPKNTKEYVGVQFSFPLMFERVLMDNDVNAAMHMMFMAENMQFQHITMSVDEESDMVADVMREQETGTGGNMFEY